MQFTLLKEESLNSTESLGQIDHIAVSYHWCDYPELWILLIPDAKLNHMLASLEFSLQLVNHRCKLQT